MQYPFHWLEAATVTISASAVNAVGALLKMPTGQTQIRVYNKGPNVAFIRKGTDSSATAVAATDLPIGPGVTEILTLSNLPASPITHVAAICAAAETATVYITTGAGI